ncbi:MAG: DUF368 domain-containing protein [Verrucomicrobia bacterium]|nr:DUF368 domain-containing protein [Verrucomicrobiota bacterium]MCH8510106.1 DUF368 domain-containing protein [Kiritimatiellia bacterium]
MTDHSHPQSIRERIYVFFTGLCMGAADIVPGVSGGTMALIMGVYEDLLAGIKSFDVAMLKEVFTGKWKAAFARPPWIFLILLGGGIITAILSLSQVIKHLYEFQQILLFAFFFGLIVASILVLARTLPWNAPRFLALGAGTAFGLLFVSLTPQQMPHDPLTVFLCGAVAIMAMILPGVSGAFLLLILGQYAWVLEQLNGLRETVGSRDVSGLIEVFLNLLPLGLGAVCGLLFFARILSWLLNKYHWATLAVLIGFMVGSLRKIWPWREVTESVMIGDKERILADRMVAPEFNAEFAAALGLALAGLVLILGLEWMQGLRTREKATEPV